MEPPQGVIALLFTDIEGSTAPGDAQGASTSPGSVRARMPFRHRLRVRYGECDPQGIVFNANYLLYFDVAFTELWREAVGPWLEMTERGYDAVVAEARLTFRAPARFDDELDLVLGVVRLGGSSIATSVDVVRGDEVLVAGELRHVVLSTQTWRPVRMPEWIRTGLQRFAATSA